MPQLLAGVGQPPGRADRRHTLRLPQGLGHPAGLRKLQLAARDIPGGDPLLRDHRGRHRASRSGAPGSVRDAPFLRLQHGGLLRALAGNGAPTDPAAPHFSSELVPQGRGREIPVAGVRGKPTGVAVDYPEVR